MLDQSEVERQEEFSKAVTKTMRECFANPGVPVTFPQIVKQEWRKALAGEPSLFETITPVSQPKLKKEQS